MELKDSVILLPFATFHLLTAIWFLVSSFKGRGGEAKSLTIAIKKEHINDETNEAWGISYLYDSKLYSQ